MSNLNIFASLIFCLSFKSLHFTRCLRFKTSQNPYQWNFTFSHNILLCWPLFISLPLSQLV